MPIRKYNPPSPGIRGKTSLTFEEITTNEPYAPLTESLLGSKVESVRTSLAHGKFKRQGKHIGRRSDWKKAYVKLRDGEKLPDFLQGA